MTSYSTVQKQQLSQLGAYLQEKRQEQGKSLEDISLQTYIRAQLLKAVENGDPSDLPQPIFVQGFIRRYADVLGLDGANFAKQFPVHSIPDTPRPIPQPAVKVDGASYQTALQNPPITTGLSSSRPARIGALPRQAKSIQPPVAPKPAATVPANDSDFEPPADTPSVTDELTVSPSVKEPSPEPDEERLGKTSVLTQEPEPLTPPAEEEQVGALPMETPAFKPMGSSLATDSRINWLPWGIGAAGLVGAIALISSLMGRPAPEPTPQAATPPEVAAVEEPEPAPAPAPEPEPEPVSTAPVSLKVEITEAGPSWMRIVVDGSVAFEGQLAPGTQESWEAQDSISMNVGNAGAALISVNGNEPQPAGDPGGAEFLTFTPEP